MDYHLEGGKWRSRFSVIMKKLYQEKEYKRLLPSLCTCVDSLINEQIVRREANGREGIKHIFSFVCYPADIQGVGKSHWE